MTNGSLMSNKTVARSRNARGKFRIWIAGWRARTAISVVTVLVVVLAACFVFPPRLIINALNARDSAVFVLPTNEPMIALTIDDGPDPETTPVILEVLARHDTKATFFVFGKKAEAHPEMMRAIVAAGHEIANHGWEDHVAKSLSEKKFAEGFADTEDELKKYGDSKWYRPGGGHYTPEMLSFVKKQHQQLVVGSIYPHDAHLSSVLFSTTYIYSRAKPGDVVVLHDGGRRGARTAEVLQRVIPAMRYKGLSFVTLSVLDGEPSDNSVSE